jgi:uncharacterized membrane protein
MNNILKTIKAFFSGFNKEKIGKHKKTIFTFSVIWFVWSIFENKLMGESWINLKLK